MQEKGGNMYLEGIKWEKLLHSFQTAILQWRPMKKPQGWGRPRFGEVESQEPLFETAKTCVQEGLYSLQGCGEVRKAFPSICEEQN